MSRGLLAIVPLKGSLKRRAALEETGILKRSPFWQNSFTRTFTSVCVQCECTYPDWALSEKVLIILEFGEKWSRVRVEILWRIMNSSFTTVRISEKKKKTLKERRELECHGVEWLAVKGPVFQLKCAPPSRTCQHREQTPLRVVFPAPSTPRWPINHGRPRQNHLSSSRPGE